LTHERLAASIFLCARTFADKKPFSALVTHAKHRLAPLLMENA
jgi:hypothetical protein